MQVVLFRPEIPQNAGNVVRTCAVTGASLMLVTPLGFSTSDRRLRRAGLDYWEGVDVTIIDDLEAHLRETSQEFYFFSSKGTKCYTDINYQSNDLLIFGSETSGLPAHYYQQWQERLVTIPMLPEARCLNLATSVGIVVYEAWRQQKFNNNRYRWCKVPD